jgi:hypothetical protein
MVQSPAVAAVAGATFAFGGAYFILLSQAPIG